MKVRVDELPDTGRVIHFHKTDAWLAPMTEDTREITLARPVEVDLELVPEADSIKLRGRMRGAVQIACSRCLQDFILDLDEAIDFTLLRPLSADAPHQLAVALLELVLAHRQSGPQRGAKDAREPHHLAGHQRIADAEPALAELLVELFGAEGLGSDHLDEHAHTLITEG